MSTYSRTKASCVLCHSEMATNMISRHYGTKQCLSGGKFTDRKPVNQCKHCSLSYDGMAYSEKMSHIKTCSTNPNNSLVIAAERLAKGNYNSEATREKIKQGLKRALIDGKMKDRSQLAVEGRKNACYKHSEETKEKIRNSMRSVAKNNPEKYSGGKYNRGNVKTKICSNGMTVIGGWEEIFVEFCLTLGATVTQPIESFEYEWEGTRSYYPDFYLPEYDIYVEVKGLKTGRDDSKWSALTATNGKRLLIVDRDIINRINTIDSIESLISYTEFK